MSLDMPCCVIDLLIFLSENRSLVQHSQYFRKSRGNLQNSKKSFPQFKSPFHRKNRLINEVIHFFHKKRGKIMRFYGNRTNACFVKSYESVTNFVLNRFLIGAELGIWRRYKNSLCKDLVQTFR